MKLLFASLILSARCLATEYYVTPLGNGDGSKTSPWNLSVALTNSSVIAGDKVWLRAGTYPGLFTSTLSGTENTPIVVRNFNKERAIIDGRLGLGDSVNTWFWGIEFIDSSKTNRTDPFATIDGGASGTKFINCLIHDCCIGINSTGSRPSPYEAYGNVMWYCGKSGQEHGLYLQNEGPAVKLARHNLIGYSYGFGIHCYGSIGKINNMQIIENAVWGSGALWDGKSDILMGAGDIASHDQLILSNNTYNPGGRGLDLGYGQHDTNVTVAGNTVMAAYPMWLRNESTSYSVTNNLMGTFYGAVVTPFFDAFVYTNNHVWDYNAYYNVYENGLVWSNNFESINFTTSFTFLQWKAQQGFDAHSTYTHFPSYESRVYVWPNAYESKRAHIVIWNFGLSNTVPVDLRSVLSAGDKYEIRNAMDYFASPVASGTFDNNPITLALTNLTTATPINTYPVVYPDESNFTTNFAAFVLIGNGPPQAIIVNGTIVNAHF